MQNLDGGIHLSEKSIVVVVAGLMRLQPVVVVVMRLQPELSVFLLA
jgi:hypothetical protein